VNFALTGFYELRFDGDRQTLTCCEGCDAKTLYSGKVEAMTP
jgi:hypothetical protein